MTSSQSGYCYHAALLCNYRASTIYNKFRECVGPYHPTSQSMYDKLFLVFLFTMFYICWMWKRSLDNRTIHLGFRSSLI